MAERTTTALFNPVNSERRKEGLKIYFLPILTAALLLILWQIGVTVFSVPEYIVPAPVTVALTLTEKFSMLMKHFLPTFVESILGFALGNIAAILVACTFVYNRHIESAFYPIAVFVNTIPILAVAPIIVLIFGPGLTAKVVIAASICFFPTLVNMVKGLQSLSKETLELAQILSASKAEVLWKMRLPASMPYLFSALKIASTTCVIGAIVGEWVGADVGLGALILDSTFNFRSPLLYATIFLASGLSVALFTVVCLLEKLMVKW